MDTPEPRAFRPLILLCRLLMVFLTCRDNHMHHLRLAKEGRMSKKGPLAHNIFVTEEMSSASGVNLPSSSLTALRLLSILPPSSQADVPRVVKDLKVKKARFEAKQAREAIAEVPGLVPQDYCRAVVGC